MISDDDYFPAFKDITEDDLNTLSIIDIDSSNTLNCKGESSLLREKILRLENEKMEMVLQFSAKEEELKNSFHRTKISLEAKLAALLNELNFRVYCIVL